MKRAAIKKAMHEKGIAEVFVYSVCRCLSKFYLHVFGRIFQRYGKICPRRIVFKNRQQQDVTDNARALYEYLLENGYNEKYQIVWLVSDPNAFRGKQSSKVRFVKAESKHGYSSLRAYYYGATAAYFFYTNNTADLNRFRCKGQITVNLWHGCGYKGATRKKNDIPRSKTMEWFDYALVPGPVFVKTKADYWDCPKEKVLPLGLPRYDWMLDSRNRKKDFLEKIFQWKDKNTKLILWMPTFRQSSLNGYAEAEIELPYILPSLEREEDLEEINHMCEKYDLLLVIKKHPLQTGWAKEPKEYSHVRYVSDEMLKQMDIPLYRLVGVADALLSDYSSIAVDFLLLDRPLGYVLTDYEIYAQKRGFIFEHPLDYMPGEHIYQKEDLEKFLLHIAQGMDVCQKKRHACLPQMHCVRTQYRKNILDYFHITK